ncbi:MAG: DedA family protein [Pyrinomonadaceae bacterium]|nr:DedA family protein [Pyrinomonadaceae bacterium]
MDENFFYELVGHYGLYAVFFLALIEGDITLLLAGVLAHSAFFGEWSFPKVLAAGTLGGFVGDQIAYWMGRACGTRVSEYRFYRHVRTRVERLTENFGALSIFLSKYIYGLRTASCVFYGVGRMSYRKFVPLSLASCFVWVFVLSGAGYFFSGAVMNLIGDFHQLGIYLLVIVIVGVAGFYLAERYWLGKKVETADPEKIHKIEHAAQGKLQEIGHEIQERIHLPGALERRKEAAARKRDRVASGETDGD